MFEFLFLAAAMFFLQLFVGVGWVLGLFGFVAWVAVGVGAVGYFFSFYF